MVADRFPQRGLQEQAKSNRQNQEHEPHDRRSRLSQRAHQPQPVVQAETEDVEAVVEAGGKIIAADWIENILITRIDVDIRFSPSSCEDSLDAPAYGPACRGFGPRDKTIINAIVVKVVRYVHERGAAGDIEAQDRCYDRGAHEAWRTNRFLLRTPTVHRARTASAQFQAD